MADSIHIEINDRRGSRKENQIKRFCITERKRWLFFALPFTFTAYTLTDRKLTVKRGFFNTTEDEVPLYRILNIRIYQNFIQKLFRIGSLDITAADINLPYFEIRNIKNFRKFKNLLEKSISADRQREGVTSAEIFHSARNIPALRNSGKQWLYERKIKSTHLSNLQNRKEIKLSPSDISIHSQPTKIELEKELQELLYKPELTEEKPIEESLETVNKEIQNSTAKEEIDVKTSSQDDLNNNNTDNLE